MAEAVREARRAAATAAPVLEVRNLVKRFPIGGAFDRGVVHAVEDVSFALAHGETLGIVGESGCGKTTLGKTVMRLLEPEAGSILLKGRDVTHLGAAAMRALRRDIQMVFQDPFSSLDPRMTCARIVAQPLYIHGVAGADLRDRLAVLFDRVGLSEEAMDRYPHQLSGGQRQRLGIARALTLEPDVIVADEPVSALDVSVQAQVLNLMRRLQEDLGLAYLFIGHDLAVVEHVSHRVAVMYLGRIVELADRQAIFSRPLHPYTEALLDAVPVPRPGQRKRRQVLRGDVPSPVNPPPGCAFHTRCPLVRPVCRETLPPLVQVAPGQTVACHVRAPG